MITAERISKTFHHTEAVRNISFSVKSGETMVLLGTSGCGKTTTLKMLNRLIEASAGEITIEGQNIFSQKPETLRRTIGYVSQNDGLFPHYTVSENIAIVPRLLGWNQKDIDQKTRELTERLQIPVAEFGKKLPATLSGGQKQRVAIARALIADPPVLLMDEPFGALDPVTRADVRREFLQLPEFKRKTTVLVTHDIQEAFELGDHICLMDRGRIVQSGTAKELLFHPENAFVKSFFDHQRLFLELQSLHLIDAWEFLQTTGTTPATIMKVNQTFWEALEALSATNAESVGIMHENGELKTATQVEIYAIHKQLKLIR